MKKTSNLEHKKTLQKSNSMDEFPPDPETTQVRAESAIVNLKMTKERSHQRIPLIKKEPENLRIIHKPIEWQRPAFPRPKAGFTPTWHSVLLFFNLSNSVAKPSDYQTTTIHDALEFLDEGTNPAVITISEFMANYWGTLSYGNITFGINTPRDSNSQPLVPTVTPTNGASAWRELINLCIQANAVAVWQAAGSLTLNGKRWIPSLVLVQNYYDGLSADLYSRVITVDGIEYEIGDQHHMHYNIVFSNPNNTGQRPENGRSIWGRMCHEYAHNFLEFGDLYGGSGCTGYWDLHGDNSPPTKMSEVSSHIKERAGWLQFKQVIEGPNIPNTALSLQPYTTTGDAIKVVPAPQLNPYEFFLLEFRKSTGDELWRPDGGLNESGLLVTHINTRMLHNGWQLTGGPFLRDAPFFDPEFADFSDNGGTLWTGSNRLDGILYPQPGNDAFTSVSSPNSNLYGQVPSGLEITNIQVVGNELRFNLALNNNARVGWALSGTERGLAGHFLDDPVGGTEQIFFRDAANVALLVHRQAQWLVHKKQTDWIGNWHLGPDNYEVIADLDGDGFDEVYIRSPEWAGVFKWQNERFQSITVQHDWIDQWNLGPDNRELAADLDGDGVEEIYIRSPNWAGVLKLINGRLYLLSIQHDWIDQWNLGSVDKEWRGRFTQANRDEILIKSTEWLGLFEWDSTQQRLRLKSIQFDWIDQWNMGPGDRHYIGDFDGDGVDEIYIRSSHWAGVLKWNGSRFQLLWIAHLTLNSWDGDNRNNIDLTATDESNSGKFLDTRDGILHRYTDGIIILHWQDNQMKVRHKYRSSLGNKWVLGAHDKFVLGQFVRGGPDVGNPSNTIIQPGLTGLFIHNAWGTASVGVNYRQASASDLRENINLNWIQRANLLYAS